MSQNHSLPAIEPPELEVVPIERSETIPAAWYTDPAFHAFDLEAVFARTWQYIGHVSQLSQPGDYIVGEALGNPVLVVHDDDGNLNAFHNVCRHRGGPLARENGCARRLQCKYHAWSYGLDGQLIGVPRFKGVECFEKKDYGLVPIRMDVWQGLIFVDLSGEARPLPETLEGIAEEISPIALGDMHHVRRETYDCNCNWKAYVDNFLEGYHIRPVHPELAEVIDVAAYTTEMRGNHILQHSRVTQGNNQYHVEGDGRSFYYYVFPNLMLNILPTRLQLNVVVPVSEDRTQVLFDFYYLERDPERLKQISQDDFELSDLIQRQDAEICERVQAGLRSPSYHKGRFSVLEEQGVWAFQSLLKRAYQAYVSSGDGRG